MLIRYCFFQRYLDLKNHTNISNFKILNLFSLVGDICRWKLWDRSGSRGQPSTKEVNAYKKTLRIVSKLLPS